MPSIKYWSNCDIGRLENLKHNVCGFMQIVMKSKIIVQSILATNLLLQQKDTTQMIHFEIP